MGLGPPFSLQEAGAQRGEHPMCLLFLHCPRRGTHRAHITVERYVSVMMPWPQHHLAQEGPSPGGASRANLWVPALVGRQWEKTHQRQVLSDGGCWE